VLSIGRYPNRESSPEQAETLIANAKEAV
jgi:hypothetical protein